MIILKKINNNDENKTNYDELYDLLIKKDNFWYRLNNTVDFNFVLDILKDSYSLNMGRPYEDIVRMFKFLLLKAYYKLSDRKLIERTLTDLNFKYFLGYKPEETNLISPSLLTKFRRTRLATYEKENGKTIIKSENCNTILNELIAKTVEIALNNGVIEKDNNIIVDSTHTNALYNHISPRQKLIEESKILRKYVYKIDETMRDKMPKKRETSGLLEDEIEYVNELLDLIKTNEVLMCFDNIRMQVDLLEEIKNDTETQIEYSKDCDAKIGHKTADTSFFGYKTHIAETPERIITAATITTGEKHDGKQLINLIEESQKNGINVKAIIGDGAYSEEENLNYCKNNNIKNVSKLSKVVLYGNSQRNNNFEFNKDAGMYVCKAGHMSIKKNHQKGNKNNNFTEVDNYFFDIEKCKHCPYKDGCYKDGAKSKSYSVTIKKDSHIQHMDYMKSEEFEKLYSERYKVEAKNAELKNNYDYGNASSCGIMGMTIQAGTTIFLTNIKRIFKLIEQKEKSSK